MSAPRLDINLDKITHNARMLAEDLGDRGIAVTGITKAALGSLDIAKAMLRAGMSGLGDSRIENIEAMRQHAPRQDRAGNPNWRLAYSRVKDRANSIASGYRDRTSYGLRD